jgi:hypothetical protein
MNVGALGITPKTTSLNTGARDRGMGYCLGLSPKAPTPKALLKYFAGIDDEIHGIFAKTDIRPQIQPFLR